MDVGLARDRVHARPDDADDGSLGDLVASPDRDRTELKQRDGETIRSLDRERAAAVGERAAERDPAGRRRTNGCTERSSHVEAAVLPAGVGVVAEGEAPEHWSVDGPRPCPRRRGEHERRKGGRQ
jgi:hypothetical protein